MLRLGIALLAVGSCWTAPAFAQLSPGTSGFSTAPTVANDEEYSPQKAVAFNAMFGDTTNRCMQNFVSATLVRAGVRSVVAEGLFKNGMRDWPEGAVPAIDEPDTVASIHDFARCYVAQDFAAARGLIEETGLGDKSELARMRELAPTFGPCMPQGSQIALKPMNIRMALAEALYHASCNPGAARLPGQSD